MGGFSFGGDPESFMQAPTMQAGGGAKGGGSLIAKFLDLIGVGSQVAKAPEAKPETKPDSSPEAQPVSSKALNTPSQMPIIMDAEAAFKPMIPMSGDFGQRYLDRIRPIKTLDPNTRL